MAIATSAEAHTAEELDTWLEAWADRVDEDILSSAMLAELRLMQRRHVRWGEPLPTTGPASTTHIGSGPGAERWEPLVAEYFNATDIPWALCIIQAESKGDPSAKNPYSTAAGLWQFLRSTWDDMVPTSITGASYAAGGPYDPRAATRAARWLMDNVGRSQWNANAGC